MDAHDYTPRPKIDPSLDMRSGRQFTDDEKLRIVEESYRDGVTAASVARQHKIKVSMLYDWRHRERHGLLAGSAPFVGVVAMNDASGTDAQAAVETKRPSELTIVLGDRCHVVVPLGFDMEAVARLLNGLGVTR